MLLDALIAVGGTAVLLAAAGLVGVWMLDGSGARPHGVVPLAVLLGLGALGAVAALAAAGGVLSPALVYTVTCAALFFGGRRVRARARPALLASWQRFRAAWRDRLVRALVFGIALAVLFGLLLAVVPPVFYDELVYELAVPQDWLAGESMRFSAASVHANMPGHWLAIGALALAWGGDAGPQVLSFSLWLATAALVAAMVPDGAPAEGARARVGTAGLALGAYTGWLFSSFGKADLYFTACLIAALGLLSHGERPRARIAGLCLGLAAASKYTGLPAGLLLLALVGLAAWRSRERLRSCGEAALLFAAVAAPWYVRNLVWTGDPIYPGLARFLGDPAWSARQSAILAAESRQVIWSTQTPASLGSALWSLLGLGDADRLAFPAGLFAAAILVLALWAWRRPALRLQIAFGLSYLVFWLFSFRLERLALPAILALVPAACVVLQRCGHAKLLAVAGAAAAVLGAGQAAVVHDTLYGSFALFAGQVAPRDFVARQVGCLAIQEQLAASSAAPGSVLFAGETRRFYARLPVVAPSAMNQSPLVEAIRAGKPDDVILSELKAAGFAAVLYNPREMARLERTFQSFNLTSDARERLKSLLATRLPRLGRADGCDLYSIPP